MASATFKGGHFDGTTRSVPASISGASTNAVLVLPVGVDPSDSRLVALYGAVVTASPVPRSHAGNTVVYQLNADTLWHYIHPDGIAI